jgi:hypothetical protein
MKSFSFFHSLFGHLHTEQQYRSTDRGKLYYKEERSENFEFHTEPGQSKQFLLNNTNGTISIEGSSDGDTVKITARKIVRAETEEEAQSLLSEIEIEREEVPSAVRVRTRHPDGRHGISFQVDYMVTVPETWAISVQNKNGDVRIYKRKNSVTVELQNGTVRASDISANVHAEILNGKIHLGQNLPPNGLCDLKVTNGAIDLLLNREASAVVRADITMGTITAHQLNRSSTLSREDGFRCVLNDGKGIVNLSVVNGKITIGYT